MKKIAVLLGVCLALGYTDANSQAVFRGKNGTRAVKDSVSDTGVDTMVYTLTKGYDAICISPIITKVSGTVAGTTRLQHSLDGVNWFIEAGDTLTNTNQAVNSKIWVKNKPVRYWRLITTGSGTMKVYCEGKLQTD